MSDQPDLEAPIFLLAASWRTGSTLLQRLVTAVDGVLIWGEGSFFHHFAHVFRQVNEHFERVKDNYELLRSGKPHLEWIPVLSPPPDDVRAGFRAFMDRVYAEPTARLGFRRWGAKEVREDAVAAAQIMASIYPRARFVFLVRDPFATLASVQKADFFHNFKGSEDFIRYWNDNANDFIDPEKVRGLDHILMRYEDLILDTEEDHPQVKRLMDFLDLEAGPAVFEALRKKAGQSDRKPLSDEDAAMVARVTERARGALGYAAP